MIAFYIYALQAQGQKELDILKMLLKLKKNISETAFRFCFLVTIRTQ